jgi:hypothetical protein
METQFNTLFNLLPLPLQAQAIDFIVFLAWKAELEKSAQPEITEKSTKEYDELLTKLLLERADFAKQNPESNTNWADFKKKLYTKYEWQQEVMK